MTNLARTLTGTALVLLAGCGGDDAPRAPAGQTPAPTATATSTPSPTPSPTPTPASHLPPAPFGLTQSQDFALVGWSVVPGSPALADSFTAFTPDIARLRWSAAAGTYELAIAAGASGTLVYAFPGNNRDAFRLIDEGGVVTDYHISISQPQPPIGVTNVMARFSLFDRAADRSLGSAVFGIPTPAGSLPASGIRRYTTAIVDEYSPLISYDLATGRISGMLKVAWEDAFGPYQPMTYMLDDLVVTPGSVAFSGTFTVPDAPFQGRVIGRLMGPTGNQLALAVMTPIQNIYTWEWEARAFAVPTYQCTQCN